MGTNSDDEDFKDSAYLAQREAVLPAGAVLTVAFETRRILVLHRSDARAAVGVALPIRQRKSLEVDVRRRIGIGCRRRLRLLRLGSRRHSAGRRPCGRRRAACRRSRSPTSATFLGWSNSTWRRAAVG